MLAIDYNIPSDSIKYERLFERITSLHLTLSNKELGYLRLYLIDFGFIENERSFSKPDFEIV